MCLPLVSFLACTCKGEYSETQNNLITVGICMNSSFQGYVNGEMFPIVVLNVYGKCETDDVLA